MQESLLCVRIADQLLRQSYLQLQIKLDWQTAKQTSQGLSEETQA
jgi:hypothetical protein